MRRAIVNRFVRALDGSVPTLLSRREGYRAPRVR